MKGYYRIYIVIFWIILAGMGFVSLSMPEREYSENENRYLDKFPKVTIQSILDGEFMKKFENAFSDQFTGRDVWMSESTVSKRVLGFEEVNGLYFGKDNYLITKITDKDIDKSKYIQNLRFVGAFNKDFDGQLNVMLVPSTGTILSDKLPDNAPFYDSTPMYRSIWTVVGDAKFIDVRAEEKDGQSSAKMYYKTDHHWTLKGAYEAYKKFCNMNGMSAHTYDYFKPKQVTKDFKGTLQAKVLATGISGETIFAPTNIPMCKVQREGQEFTSIYDVEKLTKKDKYGYFFGGNFGEVRITMNENPKKRLLVIKDSFANSFVPFLMHDYDEIVMIDLRYFRQSMKSYLENEKFDQALVLYEISNFAGESNISKLVH